MLRIGTNGFGIGLMLIAASVALAADPPAPVTTADAKVSTADLELLLIPLTRDELTVEANGWQKLLQAKVTEISAAEIAAGKAEKPEDKTKLLEQASALRDERAQISDRLKIVIAELKDKGGKPEDYETYINAVSGITVKVTDVNATWVTVVNWLRSKEGGIRYGRNIILFIVTLIVFRVIAGIVGGITGRAMSAFRGTSNLLRDFVVNTIKKIVFFVGFVVALSMLEVNIGPFLAAMGAAGFVIGFALQGTLSNFAAGVMILLYRPYDIGDTVTVAGATGKVVSMNLVSTTLKNAEGHTVTIPNSSIWGGTITNFTVDEAPAAKPSK